MNRNEGEAGGIAICDMLEMFQIDEGVVSSTVWDPGCSKNVMRKQRNWERTLALKKSKRKEEKRRRKQNRVQDKVICPKGPQLSKRMLKAITKERLEEARLSGPRLCVDLSMTDCMSHKEISRLAGQIRRVYGLNRKAAQPFHLFLTDLSQDSLLYRECVRMNDGFREYSMEMTEKSWLEVFPEDDVVFLTPDAEEALQSVETEKVYILGGLVDESIQKKMSYTKAMELGVCTARLPIEEYMIKKDNPKNFHSKILTINQVFEILLTFCDTGSWVQALAAGVPPGKGYMLTPEATLEMKN
ncbi:tRNA methyltransferase 10 homolog B [Denticeps clupeoides]|uniref:tRNA methyltransferase 10 homolog B n=1 Tax=Denticeps clupeoides TaxID=299321 RepID=A0AAY4D4F6_9TELE|nr:tRNA methyltransferase 10 homolog B [Denticeps clupeoides]